MKIRKIAYNIIGITVLYLACFCYGHHTVITGNNDELADIRYGKTIARAAKAFNMDPALIAAVIQAESNFNPKAVSGAGARGLMQIIPSTGRHLKLNNAYDPGQNIYAGSRYLRELLDSFDGDVVLALAAYNAGPGAVARHDGVPPYKQTRAYVRRVLAFYGQFRAAIASGPSSS